MTLLLISDILCLLAVMICINVRLWWKVWKKIENYQPDLNTILLLETDLLEDTSSIKTRLDKKEKKDLWQKEYQRYVDWSPEKVMKFNSWKPKVSKKENLDEVLWDNRFILPRRVRSRDIHIKDRGQRLAYKQGWNTYRSLLVPKVSGTVKGRIKYHNEK
jgi:hypothetical protein